MEETNLKFMRRKSSLETSSMMSLNVYSSAINLDMVSRSQERDSSQRTSLSSVGTCQSKGR